MLDAGRILSVIDSRIDKNTGAALDVTYGQVHGTSGVSCSVYLAGSRELALSGGDVPVPSEGFRVPAHLSVSQGDFVKVTMDRRGHRWVDEVFPRTTTYSQASIDVNRGILLGDGSAAPSLGRAGQVPMVNATGQGMAFAVPSDLMSFPFVFNNPAGTTTNAEMNAFDSANSAVNSRVVMPWDFAVVGVSVRTSSARTAGTLTVKPRINGTDTGVSATLDGTNTVSARGTGLETSTPNQGVAGNDIGLVYTTSGWTPTATYIYGVVFVLMLRPVTLPSVVAGSFTADAILAARPASTGAFTANAALAKTTSSTFTADAVLVSTPVTPSGFTGHLGTPGSELGQIILGKG